MSKNDEKLGGEEDEKKEILWVERFQSYLLKK